MSHVTYPLAKRLQEARMTFDELSFMTRIAVRRLKNISNGRVEPTDDEATRIDLAIAHKPIVWKAWRSATEAAARGFRVPTVVIPMNEIAETLVKAGV